MAGSLEESLAWSAIRVDAVDSFQGQTPRPEDESAIITIFELQPQLVQRKIEEVAKALHQGKITWAWSALKAVLEKGAEALREANVDVTTSRARAVRSAERWLENAGCLYDRAEHVEKELFGDPEFGTSGLLDDYADDQDLRKRMLARWWELRPRGELSEQQAEEHARRCVDTRKRVADLKREAAKQTLGQLTAAAGEK